MIKNDQTYDLGELAEYVDLKIPRHSLQETHETEEGRNSSIFNTVRKLAYRYVSKCSSESELRSRVDADCVLINSSFKPKLTQKELCQIAKSISNWTWKHRQKIGVDAVSEVAMARLRTSVATIRVTCQLGNDCTDEMICKNFKPMLVALSRLSLSHVKRAIKKGI